MCRNNHGVAVDYYAVGVIAYECMMGQVLYCINIDIATLSRKESQRNPRPNVKQTGSDKGQRAAYRLDESSIELHQQSTRNITKSGSC